MLPSVMVISDSTQTNNITDTLKQCIDNGANFIGVREYDMSDADLSHLLETLIKYSQNSGTLLSVWNKPDLAEKLSIGLHMPSATFSPALKSQLDYDSPLGKSCHNAQEISSASHADYITLSPIYNSISKQGYEGMGIAQFKDLLGYARQPVFALGGITSININDILETGCYGVAICGDAMRNPHHITDILKAF